MSAPKFARIGGVTRLDRLTDGRVMCCICFDYMWPDDLWTDAEGQKWDMCQPCGEREALARKEIER